MRINSNKDCFFLMQNIGKFICRFICLAVLAIVACGCSRDQQSSEETVIQLHIFGGSTMVGEPYWIDIGQLIKFRNPELKVFNHAGCGRESNFALKKIKEVTDQYKSENTQNIALLYVCHNEFLRFADSWGFSFKGEPVDFINRLASEFDTVNYLLKGFGQYRLTCDERQLFDKRIIPAEEFDGVLAAYEQNMTESIRLLRKNGFKCIVVAGAANFCDWEPNRSVFNGTDDEKRRLKESLEKGALLLAEGKPHDALTVLNSSLNITKDFAELNYRIAECYKLIGNMKKAAHYYKRASDTDGLPLRLYSGQYLFLQNLEQVEGVHVIDFERLLRQESKDQLIGYNLFADAHHPLFRGYFVLAKEVAVQLKNMNCIKKSIGRYHDLKKHFNIDSDDIVLNVYLSRAKWTLRLSTWRFDPKARLDRVKYLLDQADLIAETTESKFLRALFFYLKKEPAKGDFWLDQACKQDKDYVEDRLTDHWIKSVIARGRGV